ncbi:MAG: phage baseplate assembly protein V [Desulfobacterales bacterium]|nr:phage baseplate assembly protein V [Desulfobacterales bacterium]
MSEGLFGMYLGTVVSVEDPLQANRVRVSVPGICEPFSNWARPKGWIGAAYAFGSFGVPPEGSQVLVQFEAGDIDSPWYEPAAGSAGEAPPEVRGSLTKWLLGFGDIRILVEATETGQGKLKIYSAQLPGQNEIILDGQTNTIAIRALTHLTIEAVGLLELRAGLLTLQGRPVAPGGKPI